jgi:hypothetical protein
VLSLLPLSATSPKVSKDAVPCGAGVGVGHSLSLYTSFLNHFNIYNHWIMHNVLNFANVVFRYWDRGLVELLGPMGLVQLFHYYSFQLELLATGFIPHYAFLIIFISFLVALVALLSLPASLLFLFLYLFLLVS